LFNRRNDDDANIDGNDCGVPGPLAQIVLSMILPSILDTDTDR